MTHDKKLLVFLACYIVLQYSIRNVDAVRQIIVGTTGNKQALPTLTDHWLREHIWHELRVVAGLAKDE